MAKKNGKGKFAHDSETAFSAPVAIDGSNPGVRTHDDPRGKESVETKRYGTFSNVTDSRPERKERKGNN